MESDEDMLVLEDTTDGDKVYIPLADQPKLLAILLQRASGCAVGQTENLKEKDEFLFQVEQYGNGRCQTHSQLCLLFDMLAEKIYGK